jgi:hypothetical protein
MDLRWKAGDDYIIEGQSLQVDDNVISLTTLERHYAMDLDDGIHEVEIRVWDVVGRITSVCFNTTVDTRGPYLSYLRATRQNTDHALFEWMVIDDLSSIGSVTVLAGGKEIYRGEGVGNVTLDVSRSPHVELTITAADAAGNQFTTRRLLTVEPLDESERSGSLWLWIGLGFLVMAAIVLTVVMIRRIIVGSNEEDTALESGEGGRQSPPSIGNK